MSDPQAALTLSGVSKKFGAVEVIPGLDLSIENGEFTVFVGPSGCGKSTLLRMIAGLEDVSTGSVEIDGRDVTQVAAADRGVAMVFQSYALYPHMTVRENLSFGLENIRMPRNEIDSRVNAAAALLQIDALMERRPRQLSGGQRQRVAIGRAITRDPKIFLFDEPLSNLDAELRVQMRVEITRLHKRLGNTMIYVTHDQIEAMTMADRIVVLRGGRIEQHGRPLDLYNRPANRFVAGFIGSPRMNFVEGRAAVAGGKVSVVCDGLPPIGLDVPAGRVTDGATVSLGVRAEHLVRGDGPNAWPVRVSVSEQYGSSSYLHCLLPGDRPFLVFEAGQSAAREGDEISVRLPAAACHLFDADGVAITGDTLVKPNVN